MPQTRRPRLIMLKGESPLDDSHLAVLRDQFELLEAHDLPHALRLMNERPGACYLLYPPESMAHLDRPGPTEETSSHLHSIAEAVAAVDAGGRITWANGRFRSHDEHVTQMFIERCVSAARTFAHQRDPNATPSKETVNQRFCFESASGHFEMIVCPAASANGQTNAVGTVVGVLWEITDTAQQQARLEAIDAAGSELLRIESASIADLNMAERLQLLEEKIIYYVHDLLHFDNFEIRLLDRDTNRLELVISEGLTPMKIGEVLYAQTEGNGISGFVAATGRSYICADVAADPRYKEGLTDAGSALTVPLRLHDRVIGVFNVESRTPGAFTDNDRQFAEILGRYIAMAMNILDLLVVERYTTNEQLAATFVDELSLPLTELMNRATILLANGIENEKQREQAEGILQAAETMRRRIETCSAGPRTILGAEREMNRLEPDPAMIGRRVLVADDEPLIRETVRDMLTQKGCVVTICEDGAETIEHIEHTANTIGPFDLVISDIKMPSRNGYEIFRAVNTNTPDTPVILMTGFGYDPHHSIVRASQEGLSAFLFKPFRATQLLDAVNRALTGERA
jgi:CheY-like chemotaxis protein/PAS domain-containing protein